MGLYIAELKIMEIETNQLQEGVPSEAFYSVGEIARHFGYHETTLKRWLKRYAELPRLKTPTGTRLRVSDVLAWLNKFN
jgi:transposase-like protein